MQDERLVVINNVINDYFEKNQERNIVPAKELMPYFVIAGVFPKDVKKGLPIRKILRELDDQNALQKIPSLHVERKNKNTFWYFLREGSQFTDEQQMDSGLTKRQRAKINDATSDKHYLINLCDDLLDEKASRKHKFGFILADYHKAGRNRNILPVDAYYSENNIVLEFITPSDAATIDHSKRRTFSGITRAQQNANYAERRKKGVLAKGINFLEIPYDSFDQNDDNQLIRNQEKDLQKMRDLLKDFLK